MKKKILYIHQYFFHPKESGGTRTYWISQELLKAGYDVTVITQRNPLNPFHRDAKKVERKNIDGINVVYIRNPYAMNYSIIKRFWAFFKFMIRSTRYALKEKDVSLLIASSTPLSIGFPALILKKFKKTPFIFEVRDLWPEVPIQMGAIKNKALIWIFRKFESTIYKNAIHIDAFSPGMAAGIIKYVSQDKVSVISNMSKIDKFWPREKNQSLLAKLGLSSSSFKIIHFGAMGKANLLDNFVDAARINLLNAASNREIEFILVGGGSCKPHYQKRKEDESLVNLFIFDRLAMDDLSELVNLCDVTYVGFAPIPILETNSANKFFDSLSACKPIIINYGGWMQELIESNECGLRVHPADPDDLLEKIMLLKNDAALRDTMGKNARKLAETQFDKSVLCPKYVSIIDQVIRNTANVSK